VSLRTLPRASRPRWRFSPAAPRSSARGASWTRIEPLERRLTILTPDGKLVSAADPNQKTFGTFDGRFVLVGQGRQAEGGIVFGNQTIKIGAPMELEGSNYRVSGTVTNLQLGGR